MIEFNKPYLTGKELHYINQSVNEGKISGDGIFTKKCHEFLENKYNFKKVLLTTSCTDALEMAAILLGIKYGDEVIAPSYTFVSTVNAFVLRGAKIIFIDSEEDHPNMDANKIEELITEKTKVIIPVHYSGHACDMEKIMEIANKYDLFVVEDAAQSIDSYYINKDGESIPIGSIGHMSAFSFHETKNIISGEGGMLVINDDRFIDRAEIIREKGTNRSMFHRGEISKYGWVDIGSSFLPSDIIAAFLYAQLENIEKIQKRRLELWSSYYNILKPYEDKAQFSLPILKQYSSNNAHMFYLVCNSEKFRTNFINKLNKNGINVVFHYLSLHKSEYYKLKHDGRELNNSDKYSSCLVRLPFHFNLTIENIDFICNSIKKI